jgi:hypothetical protein
MNSYSVKHSHGLTETFETYEAAVESLESIYGDDVAIGHDGDISDGGETTLVWRTEEDARNDDGVRVVAKIRVRHA